MWTRDDKSAFVSVGIQRWKTPWTHQRLNRSGVSSPEWWRVDNLGVPKPSKIPKMTCFWNLGGCPCRLAMDNLLRYGCSVVLGLNGNATWMCIHRACKWLSTSMHSWGLLLKHRYAELFSKPPTAPPSIVLYYPLSWAILGHDQPLIIGNYWQFHGPSFIINHH